MSAIGNTFVPARDQRAEVTSTSWECSKAQDKIYLYIHFLYIYLSHMQMHLWRHS